MKTINFLHPIRKDSKITKNFDLKHLGILSNSEKNNLLNFHNLKNNSNIDKYSPENQDEYNSLDRITNNETIKSPKSNIEEEKIKYLINNKAINNTLTGNYFFPIRKNYYSYSKFKLSEKKILSETDKNINENNGGKKLPVRVLLIALLLIKYFIFSSSLLLFGDFIVSLLVILSRELYSS